ncbi:proline racemase [Coleophoma crateriformis]|uniref:trans-L-3-hydroxyproline dehydratase n=1 Tax=Coleophoma crateriformis TaxID=565419 RepID=A0A3D8RQ20_9HELO|nr:proline racemase [Coleophoma crateriformis]
MNGATIQGLFGNVSPPINCVEMHTTGEPTRIIWSGVPEIHGTLLEQRSQFKEKFDHFRRVLMLEPRGHWDMYGAILRPETELVDAGEADMGVLFMHNEGFSTMCGHATIALGRFLVDADETIFPRRKLLKHDSETRITTVRLHVPCGVVKITVPTLPTGKSDPSRAVSFISVPSFATAIGVTIPLDEKYRWPELQGRTSVVADFSYGGAFYCIISAEELGFPKGLSEADFAGMDRATKCLKDAVNASPSLAYCVQHPDTKELGFLYSVMIVDHDAKRWKDAMLDTSPRSSRTSENVVGEETGLCFFANQQIDRSPTGGCVAARIALSYAKGTLSKGESWMYHSILSRAYNGLHGFAGSYVEEVDLKADACSEQRITGVRVRVEGQAYYTGCYSFFVEEEDGLGADGFSLKNLKRRE